jgi:hypothetical protein
MPVQTAIIGKFEGFVTLTPESDYYFSTEHPPIITDISGRYLETILPTKPDKPSLNETLIEDIGGGSYNDLWYNSGVFLGTLNPIAGLNRINIPAFNNNPTQFEPTTTVAVAPKFDGSAFSSFQGTNWTGVGATIGSGGLPNAFTSGWNNAGEISLTSDISGRMPVRTGLD